MFALAVTGVFNGMVALCVRDVDLLRLLTKYDKIPGLPTFAISIANFSIIGAVTCAFFSCYNYKNDAYIYMCVNLVFAFTSLIFNHIMRAHAHITKIPVSEFKHMFERVSLCERVYERIAGVR